MTSNFLFVNTKWKKSDVFEALSKIQFKCIFDDLNLVDFKAGCTGFVYIQNCKDNSIAENRKLLAKSNNNNPSLKIQAIVDCSNKELFNSIQEFSVIELKIQVIPIESANDLAQYIERYMMSEFQIDKNPFIKDLTVNTNDQSISSQLYLNCLKNIPKIGDKNAQTIAKAYKNLKVLSKASVEDMTSKIGATSAKAIYEYFQSS
ncbi:unnamed protein product [Brachionus calyciflorus]|uniref:Uncharacterized protein n=1 Tax=Brachionus calyciflorus TaxID=104777 RepID=A0A813MVQ7_9BILA|nr:unnamed protein product [Brachionus calyciflorus]